MTDESVQVANKPAFLEVSDGDKILLKENVLCAIKVIRENKKRPDCQSIGDYIHNFTDSKTSVDYLHLVIQSLVDNNKIVNKPTKPGLPSMLHYK